MKKTGNTSPGMVADRYEQGIPSTVSRFDTTFSRLKGLSLQYSLTQAKANDLRASPLVQDI